MTNVVSTPAALSSLEDLQKEELKKLFDAWVERKLDTLPTDLSGRGRAIMGVLDDASGYGTGDPLSALGNSIGGYRAYQPTEISASTFAFDASNADDYSGAWIEFSNAGNQTITIDAGVGPGFCFSWYKSGSGNLIFAVSGGLTLTNVDSHTKSIGVNAVGGVCVPRGGTKLVLYGQTTT